MYNKNRKKTNREYCMFLAYAFLIPLICVCCMKGIEYVEGAGFYTFLLYGIEGASPTIAIIIVMLQKHGINGMKQFLKMRYIDGFQLKICLLGFMIPALIITIGKILTYLTPYHNEFFTGLSSKKIVIILWALIAEELGWRGYLQEQLERKFGSKLAPLILGFIWTAWHYHFFLSGSMEVPIFLFTYGCIAESYGYYVITKMSKGNVVPASIWHFAGNLFFNIYRINPNWNHGKIEPYLMVSAVYGIYFIGFLVYMHRNEKN